MMRTATRDMSVVWAALMIATLGSFAAAEFLAQPALAVAAIMLVAAFKIRLIFRHFMELRDGPLPWRLFFDVWTGGCAAMIVGLYFHALA